MLRLNETKIEGMTKETVNTMKDMPKEIKEGFKYLMQLANR